MLVVALVAPTSAEVAKSLVLHACAGPPPPPPPTFGAIRVSVSSNLGSLAQPSLHTQPSRPNQMLSEPAF